MAFQERRNQGGQLTASEIAWVATGTGGVLELVEGSAPSTVAGYGQVYVKSSDHNLYFITAGGTEYQITPSTISGAAIAAHIQPDLFTSTNNQTTFTATKIPIVANLLFIVNGQPQALGASADYTISGNNAVLNSGIPANLPVIWIYIY